jgi:serine-type D-Ala-D-Ala carboxypeptidase (penicillin-binding protein 5/6)
MKTLLYVLTLTLLPLFAQADPVVPPPPKIDARAWMLTDVLSGSVLAENDADTRVEPASLTKLMTAYLTFQALKQNQIHLDQKLPVSEKAWHMEGSRMFLDPRRPATVEDLIKGMIVQSGNDACVVLADGIAGSEEGFVTMMNEQARRLGMTGTHYANATGLPDPHHYTTASDLTRLVTALIRDFPDQYRYYSIKEFTYNGITQPNRNRLLWMDPNVDGVKTGHTDSAGYCLIASAKRGERRLLSVVLGAHSDRGRAIESQRLLNYGFQFYDTVRLFGADQAVARVKIYKGADNELAAGFPRDFYVTVPRGSGSRVQAKVITRQPMLAPVSRGQKVGTLHVTLDGDVIGDYPLLALKSVGVAGMLGRAWDSLLLLFRQ